MNFEYWVLKALLTVLKILVVEKHQALHHDDREFMFALAKELERRDAPYVA